MSQAGSGSSYEEKLQSNIEDLKSTIVQHGQSEYIFPARFFWDVEYTAPNRATKWYTPDANFLVKFYQMWQVYDKYRVNNNSGFEDEVEDLFKKYATKSVLKAVIEEETQNGQLAQVGSIGSIGQVSTSLLKLAQLAQVALIVPNVHCILRRVFK